MTAPDALAAIEALAIGVWRVVERSGAVHGLRVEASQCPIFDERFTHVALSTDVIGGFWSGPSPMGAVVRYAEASQWHVVAIYAPGEATAEERLRAIVEGRTAAPTNAEIAAHHRARGRWTVSHDHDGKRLTYTLDATEEDARAEARYGGPNTRRWWALDASGRPCAWPDVRDG